LLKPNRDNADAILDHFLKRWDLQCDAIRRGLACVVPIRRLNRFDSKDLERLVTGEKKVDIDLLKEQTYICGGYECMEDQHIQWFFQMLEDMDEEDVRNMLRFVWGRSKLPQRGADWEQSFTINSLEGGDDTLPMAHTCSFSIDLPKYSSYEIMKKRCMLAFTYAGSIDND